MTCNQRLFFCSFQWANWVRFGSFWFDINRVQYCFGRHDPELDTFPQHVDVWLIIYKSALKPLHINFSRWGHIQVDVHEIRFFIIRMYQQLDVAIHQPACNDGRESKSSPAVQLCPHLCLLLLFSRSRAGIFQIRTLSTSPTRSNGISNGFIPIRFSISKQKRLGAIHSDWTLFFYKKKMKKILSISHLSHQAKEDKSSSRKNIEFNDLLDRWFPHMTARGATSRTRMNSIHFKSIIYLCLCTFLLLMIILASLGYWTSVSLFGTDVWFRSGEGDTESRRHDGDDRPAFWY